MVAKKSIITNTDTELTGNNDIYETRASEVNEDLQKNKRKFEREGAHPFKALNSILIQQLLRPRTLLWLVSVIPCLSLSQFAPRGKLGTPS